MKLLLLLIAFAFLIREFYLIYVAPLIIREEKNLFPEEIKNIDEIIDPRYCYKNGSPLLEIEVCSLKNHLSEWILKKRTVKKWRSSLKDKIILFFSKKWCDKYTLKYHENEPPSYAKRVLPTARIFSQGLSLDPEAQKEEFQKNIIDVMKLYKISAVQSPFYYVVVNSRIINTKLQKAFIQFNLFYIE